MSVQLTDKLIEISCSEWTTLRDMYLHDWPTHMVGYNTVDNYIRWNNIKSDINNMHIYSLNGDWKRDGIFVVVDRDRVFTNSLTKDATEQIFRALVLLDWKHGIIFSSLLIRHRPAVLQAVQSKQLTLAFDHDNSLLYYMSRAEAAELEVVCPNGISLRSISQEHTNIINEEWMFKREGSLLYMQRLVDWNVNVGAYTDDGKLVAWCLRSTTGTLIALQVDSNYIHRGLGTLLLKAITKKLSDLDMDTYAPVFLENIASKKMFEKIGFKIVDYCCILETNPLIVSD